MNRLSRDCFTTALLFPAVAAAMLVPQTSLPVTVYNGMFPQGARLCLQTGSLQPDYHSAPVLHIEDTAH
jgi:hypothetical protein